MSESHLPPDVAKWPENPFELLGVAPSVDVKSLKRAYQGLIRIYRPEDRLAEFRRIREAFEAASAFLQLANSSGQTASDPSPAFPKSADDDAPRPRRPFPDQDSASPELDAPRTSPSARDRSSPEPSDPLEAAYNARLADAWQAAREERPADAYRLLQSLTAEFPDRPEPYLGRYWLLRMSGRLDEARHPCDELIDCLTKATSSRRSALELYRRELQRRPDEAETDRCKRVFRELLIDGPAFVVAEIRWRRAAEKKQWALIREDLEALRRASAKMDHTVLLLTLWTGMEATAWTSDPEAIAVHVDCKSEIERTSDARTAMIGQLSQIEYFLDVAKDVRALNDAAEFAEIRRFVVSSWSKPVTELYVDYCQLIAPYVEQYRPFVQLLTAVGEKAPAVLNRFGEIIRLMAQEVCTPEPPFWTVETARREANRFLNLAPWKSPAEFRPALLKFCVQQTMSPLTVAELVHEQKKFAFPDGTTLAQHIAADRPLQFAYESLRLFES